MLFKLCIQANDVLKGKLKDKPRVANIAIVEDPPDANNGDDLTKEPLVFVLLQAHTLNRGREASVDQTQYGWFSI